MAEEQIKEQDEFDAAYDAAFDEANEIPQDSDGMTPDQDVSVADDDDGTVDGQGVDDQLEPEAPDAGEDYQHKYSSAMGRLKASQQQNKELSDELASLKAQFEEFRNGQQKTAPVDNDDEPEIDGLDEVPEDLHQYFKEDSSDGKRLRRMIDEYGADYAITIAETIKERRELQAFRQQVENDRATRVEEDHFSKIANAVPEYADALVGPNRQTKFNELVQGVKAWIGTLSYGEGTAMERIVNEGTPDEVIDMLKAYSKFRHGSGTRDAVRNLARSNMAVPTSRNAAPPKHYNADDFDSAFDEAVRGR